ncbi:MAG: VWA domain-containing protein [Ignavibacteriales bacterium]|jgi:hypothetical protein|nr:hypothetical protein [Ignavibacteriaceae bacterium]NLH60922.1 VWA domain-containing protein [Ignavibacteriales bacterium]HOJ18914.1 hypothetical protein [Ignavibacteriaceae bacterium]HPO55776.1 hypothetical protein [Ignavibacteriaceae bacterium]
MKKIKYLLLLAAVFSASFVFVSCENEDYPYFIKVVPIVDCATRQAEIPEDATAQNAPTVGTGNISPTGVFTKDECLVFVNLIGIIDPVTNQAVELKYNQNVWLTEDGVPQGMKVLNQTNVTSSAFDIVFIIDNSGSMYEEADTISAKIAGFVQYLQSKGIDLRAGVVGYDESSQIDGALNLSAGSMIISYMTDPNYSGTYRTKHFAGSDSAQLVARALTHPTEYGENGCVAIDFADKYFSWRANGTRVYINFTDEPLQSSGASSNYFISNFLQNWTSAKGSIHTVYSISYWNGTVPDTASMSGWWYGGDERPWKLSEGTGGTTKFIHPNASDLDLNSLPVTTAIVNASQLIFVSKDPSKTHNVVITIKDVNVEGRKEYLNQGY